MKGDGRHVSHSRPSPQPSCSCPALQQAPPRGGRRQFQYINASSHSYITNESQPHTALISSTLSLYPRAKNNMKCPHALPFLYTYYTVHLASINLPLCMSVGVFCTWTTPAVFSVPGIRKKHNSCLWYKSITR